MSEETLQSSDYNLGVTYQANKIIDHLYQGGEPPTGDALRRAGVDVLVLCAAELQDNAAYTGVHIINAPGDDDERPHKFRRFIDGWRDAGRQVATHVRAGRNVLVTCYAGHNRSGIVVALALRELTGAVGSDIVDLITRRRHHALNNMTFTNYIIKSFPKVRDANVSSG